GGKQQGIQFVVRTGIQIVDRSVLGDGFRIDGTFFDKRENRNGPTHAALLVSIGIDRPGRKRAVSRFKIETGERDLLFVVLATRSSGGLAGGLDRREEERHQDADDRNHNQKFDEGESTSDSSSESMSGVGHSKSIAISREKKGLAPAMLARDFCAPDFFYFTLKLGGGNAHSAQHFVISAHIRIFLRVPLALPV